MCHQKRCAPKYHTIHSLSLSLSSFIGLLRLSVRDINFELGQHLIFSNFPRVPRENETIILVRTKSSTDKLFSYLMFDRFDRSILRLNQSFPDLSIGWIRQNGGAYAINKSKSEFWGYVSAVSFPSKLNFVVYFNIPSFKLQIFVGGRRNFSAIDNTIHFPNGCAQMSMDLLIHFV